MYEAVDERSTGSGQLRAAGGWREATGRRAGGKGGGRLQVGRMRPVAVRRKDGVKRRGQYRIGEVLALSVDKSF